MKYLDAEIEHEGRPLRVVWEYDENWHIADPARSFREVILPAATKIKGNGYFSEKLLGCFGFEFITYNFQRILFITKGNPLWDCWGSTSFPYFINTRLSEWLGYDVEYYREYPPTRPFRFACKGFVSGNNIYYFRATTEAALTRDFKQYPVTREEKAVWDYVRGVGTMERAGNASKTAFLTRYAKLINSHTTIRINNFTHITL